MESDPPPDRGRFRYSYDLDSNRTAVTTDATAYTSLVTADAPTADWHLDETSGTTAADTTGNTPGTYASGNTLGVTGATPGSATNRAVTFSGNAPLTTASTSAVTLNNSWTIEFWIKGTAPQYDGTNVITKATGTTSGNGWNVFEVAAGWLRFERDGKTYTSGTVLDGGWHQVFISYDGTNLRIGHDGNVDSTTTATFAADTSGVGLSVGNGPFSLDELSTYKTALTADRLQNHYQAALYGSYAQPGHTYDDADRITDVGTVYDTMGRTTTLPSADAGGIGTISSGGQGNVTATYYENDQVASLTNSGVVRSYTLDPLYRLDQTTYSSVPSIRTVQHYATTTSGGSESASWIETQNTSNGSTNSWTRNLMALDGLGGTADNYNQVSMDFSDLSGSLVGQSVFSNGYPSSGIAYYSEFGSPDPSSGSIGNTLADHYSWLGAHQRDQDAPAGITLMGERLYNPTLGRFLTVDPVPGGSANDYDYTNQDPLDQTDLDGQFAVPDIGPPPACPVCVIAPAAPVIAVPGVGEGAIVVGGVIVVGGIIYEGVTKLPGLFTPPSVGSGPVPHPQAGLPPVAPIQVNAKGGRQNIKQTGGGGGDTSTGRKAAGTKRNSGGDGRGTQVKKPSQNLPKKPKKNYE